MNKFFVETKETLTAFRDVVVAGKDIIQLIFGSNGQQESSDANQSKLQLQKQFEAELATVKNQYNNLKSDYEETKENLEKQMDDVKKLAISNAEKEKELEKLKNKKDEMDEEYKSKVSTMEKKFETTVQLTKVKAQINVQFGCSKEENLQLKRTRKIINEKLHSTFLFQKEQIKYKKEDLVFKSLESELFYGTLEYEPGQSIPVLIKKYKNSPSDGISDDLRRELLKIKQLDHPNIVKLIGVCPSEAIIITEFVKGINLRQLVGLESKIKINPPLLAMLLKQIASALKYSTSQGILHQNIKDGNVLLTLEYSAYKDDFDYMKAMITDYSISNLPFFTKQDHIAFSKPNSKVVSSSTSSLERVSFKSINGTLLEASISFWYQFQAPEILTQLTKVKEVYSEKSEVYAFGMLMYELMKREAPFVRFDCSRIQRIYEAKAAKFIPSLTTEEAQYGGKMKQIFEKCSDLEPHKRPTFMEVSQYLE